MNREYVLFSAGLFGLIFGLFGILTSLFILVSVAVGFLTVSNLAIAAMVVTLLASTVGVTGSYLWFIAGLE